MNVSAMHIPKSRRGYDVARELRKRGFRVRNNEVVGKYVMNLPCAHELSFDDLRAIAYLLAAECARDEEEDAFDRAQSIREMSPDELCIDDVERAARTEERSWLY